MTIVSVLAEKPRHHDLLSLQTLGGVPVIDTPLDALGRADLVVATEGGQMLGIVYLDMTGFLSAMRTKELIPRLIGAKARWPWCYLLLGFIPALNSDGKLRNSRGESSGWAWDAVSGQLLTAQEMGVGVQHLHSPDALPRAVELLARRERGPVRALPVRDGLFYSEAAALLMALPGIGESKADQLLDLCGTAAAALMALTDDTAPALPGIGPETRRKAREALGLPHDQAIGPYVVETPAKAGQKAA